MEDDQVMAATSLALLGDELLRKARGVRSGRSAVTLHGGRGRALRQTLMALRAGAALGEHESPGEATLQVLVGRVRLSLADGQSLELAAGDHVVIPARRHDLAADEDAVVLLTVAG